MPCALTGYLLNPLIEMADDLMISLLDSGRHDRTAFDCGQSALNDYLQKTASQHLQKGIANTYVLVRKDEARIIVGYFTLSFLEVDFSAIPPKYGKKLPSHHLPAAKLGRLAIDKKWQGNNYGRLLLVDAIRRVAAAIRNAAGVVGLFVDAKNQDVAAFYRKFGFLPLKDNPLSLMLPHQTILSLFPIEAVEDFAGGRSR
jgi:GNAT superfamily N-acetyltransferase